MSIVKVKCTDQVLKFESTPVISSGGLAENFVEFSFCDQWAGFVKTAVFWRSENEPYHNLLDEDGVCELPPEVACEECEIYFGVFGVDADGRRRTSNVLTYRIVKGAIVTGTNPSDPTPDIYTQLLQSYAEMQAALANAVQNVTAARDAAAASQLAAENAKKDAKSSADTALAASRGATDSKVAAAQSAKEAAKSAEDAAMLASGSFDWNADADEPGHILNRTHYDEVIVAGGTIFPASDVNFNTSMATLNGLNTADVVAGGKYIVSWKGTTYECTAFLLFEAAPDSLVIGNGYLLGGSVDTGEPFCLSDMGSSGCMITKTNAAPETVPVQVDAVRKVVTHKLPPRFLPDGFGGGMGGVDEVYIIPETALAFEPQAEIGGLSAAVLVLENTKPDLYGETIIRFNGVDYRCSAIIPDAGGTCYLGNTALAAGIFPDSSDTGEPFFAVWIENPDGDLWLILPSEGVTTATFSARVEVARPIDPRAMAFPVINFYAMGLYVELNSTCEVTVDLDTIKRVMQAANFGVAKIIIGDDVTGPIEYIATVHGGSKFTAFTGSSVIEVSCNFWDRTLTSKMDYFATT